MKKCLLLLAVALSGGVLPAGSKTFTPANGENAVRITVLPCDTKPFALDVYRAGEEKPPTIAITEQTHFFASKPGCLCLWSEDISYGEYCSRVKGKRPLPKSTFYEHAAVNVNASGGAATDYPHFCRKGQKKEPRQDCRGSFSSTGARAPAPGGRITS